MGLFSTTLHIYKKSQTDVLNGVIVFLKKQYGLNNFEQVPFINSIFKEAVDDTVYAKPGVYYLITEQKGNWTSIVELNVKLKKPFYLYELTTGLSKQFSTYALSFHLHDGGILLYNLDLNGNSLDGYNSDPPYFLDNMTPAEILKERHQPTAFSPLLPEGKNIEDLNRILNDGFWAAFDNNSLDADSIPIDDSYFTFSGEDERFISLGKYLEIYGRDDFPFIEWRTDLQRLDLSKCYLLRAHGYHPFRAIANFFQ